MAVTRGQKSSLGQVAGGAGTSFTVTWPVNPTAGSSVLLYVQSGLPALQPSTVADNGTTPATWVLDASKTAGIGNYIYRADSITLPSAGQFTVTVTVSSSRTLQGAGIEYIGRKSGGPDASNTASGTGTSVSTGSAAPAVAGGVVFGAFSDQSGLSAETITFTGSSPQVSQFTQTNGTSWGPVGVADALTGSGQNFTWTLGDSVAWGGLAVAYSPVSTTPALPDSGTGTDTLSVGTGAASGRGAMLAFPFERRDMALDKGHGRDRMGVGVHAPMAESGRERTMFTVQKWDEDQTLWVVGRTGVGRPGLRHFAAAKVQPYEVTEWHGNLITRAGWTLLLHGKTILSTDTAPTIFFDTTHGRIGVGTSSTAAAATDTALGSITSMTGNNWILCGAAPTVTTTTTPSTVVFTATFGSTDAVGAWNEFAIDQGTASAASTAATAPMLNHSASSGLAGTKASGQTWTATATLSFT